MIKKILYAAVFALLTINAVSQTTINGTVIDESSAQPIPGANIKVEGKSLGTSADFDGNFTLSVAEAPPFNLEVSIIGYATKIVEITAVNQDVEIQLTEVTTALDEVVVSASRTPERVMESPVTIERMDVRDIKNTTSPTFYDGLQNLKGVDINTNSLTNKSVNTRGFATFANTRFVQLVDGMDNSSPALNFALGNLLGMSELDVNTVEVLPGASSALYGANAFNGILFMTSKNPFEHQGVSVYAKTGITSSSNAGDNNFVDFGYRAAHAFSDKFAAKVSFSFMKGTEWHATDYRQYNPAGAGLPDEIVEVPKTATSFDRLNVYGDEVSLGALGFDLNSFAQLMEQGGLIPEGSSALIPAVNVSRTGYREVDLTDYDAQSAKADISLNYRPNGDDLEIILNSKFGYGNTIYQGANRYNIKNFFMQQHKLEIRNDNFFVRGYITAEDAGDSYDMRFTGINMNKEDGQEWFGTYVGAYLGSVLAGLTDEMAHIAAREFSDQTVTKQPGTPEFQEAFDRVTSDPDLVTGSKFQDQTKLYHVDGNYNFGHLINWGEIQVGGSWRQYSLNSNGTIFTDYDGPINYDEYGVYMQYQEKFADDRLKFTGSIRYDKAQNFEGNFSPRLSLVYSAGAERKHNFRGSFQTGFRNPTTQDQYIGLDAGAGILVGSAPDNLDRYETNDLAVTPSGQFIVNNLTSGSIGPTTTLTGREAYENAFSESSIQNGTFEKADFELVEPEKVTAFEVGYRGVIERITVDFSAYYNQYEDFIGNKNVAVPYYGEADLSDIVDLTPIGGEPTPLALVALQNGDYAGFQVYTNSDVDVTSYGLGIGLNTKVWSNYNIGFSYTWSKFDYDQEADPDFEAGFNTPEHQVKVSFGSPNAFKNFGFNVNLRYNNEYLWESTFADAVIDERTIVDAQINYAVPRWKSLFKAGAANIGANEYFSAPGNGLIGSQYFISWTVNP